MTFQARKIINGKMLAAQQSNNVSIMLNLDEAKSTGSQLIGTSVDDVSVRITMDNPQERVSASGWAEVIGRPTGPGAIRASEVIVFENSNSTATGHSNGGDAAADIEPFDVASHAMLVHFLNNKTPEELYLAE